MSDSEADGESKTSVDAVVLLPCPFCGGPPRLAMREGLWWVECVDTPTCPVDMVSTDVENSMESVVMKWNRRDGDPCHHGCKIKRAVKEQGENLTSDY